MRNKCIFKKKKNSKFERYNDFFSMYPWHTWKINNILRFYFIYGLTFSSIQFSRSVLFDSLWTHESQHARPPCPSPTLGVHSDLRPLSQWCHPAISSSIVPSPPAANPSQHQSVFQWVNPSHEVAKVLEFQLQHHSLQRNPRGDLLQSGLVG